MLEGEEQAEAASALLGRETEMALVDQVLFELPTRGGALHLYGAHGLGRSAMLEYAAARAEELGHAVLRAAGSSTESDTAYSTLNQLLQPAHSHLVRLSPRFREALNGDPDSRGGSAADEEVAAWLVRLVQGLSSQRPLVVVVDDLELVDACSTAALLEVFVRRWQPRAAIIVAGEDESRAGGWRVVPGHRLQPLPPTLSQVLLTRAHPELPTGCVSAVVSASAGHPLILRELGAEASIDPARFAQAVAAGQLPVPARLQERCAADLARLSPSGRHRVLTAALAPPGAARLGAAELMAGDQDVVRRAGLMAVAADGSLVFCHEVARRVVVELSESAERRTAHRMLAENEDVDERARTSHLAAATLAPDPVVAHSVMTAADETLGQGDPARAMREFLRAATLAPTADQQGAPLVRAAHLQAFVMGRLAEADALLRGATGHVEGRRGLRATTTDVILKWQRVGDVDSCYRLLTDALTHATASEQEDEGAVTAAFQALLMLCGWASRPEYGEGCLDLMRRFGVTNPALTLMASLFADPLANARFVGADIQRKLAALPAEPNPSQAMHFASLGLAIPLSAKMRSALGRFALEAREGGPMMPAAVAVRVLSVHAFLTGEWDEATRLADEAVEMSETSDHTVHAVASRFATALVAAGRGDVERCNVTCAQMATWAVPRNVGYTQRAVAHVRTLAALARCDYRVASHHARPFLEAALAPGDLLHLLDPVEAAVFNGDSELAEHVVGRYRRAKVEAASPHAEMLVAGARALCAEPFDASLYEEALALPAAAEFWFDRARIELRYGQRLRRARETLLARRHLEVALDLFDSMRAAPWAEQARAELLATNPATNPRMSMPADRARPPLTAQEARISELAAEGLSNAQIGERLQISARTVGAHLHHVFEKTGAKNRAMLAATLSDADAATIAPGPPDDKLRRQHGGQVEGQVVGAPPGQVGTEDVAEGTR